MFYLFNFDYHIHCLLIKFVVSRPHRKSFIYYHVPLLRSQYKTSKIPNKILKVCSHVTKVIPSRIFEPILFCTREYNLSANGSVTKINFVFTNKKTEIQTEYNIGLNIYNVLNSATSCGSMEPKEDMPPVPVKIR